MTADAFTENIKTMPSLQDKCTYREIDGNSKMIQALQANIC